MDVDELPFRRWSSPACPSPGVRLGSVSQASLRTRVEAAAAAALARQKFVTPVDVCVGIGWLQASNLEDWRRGRVDDLEYFLPVHDDRLIDLIMYLHEVARLRYSRQGWRSGAPLCLRAGRNVRPPP
jgi:hypothetical protein